MVNEEEDSMYPSLSLSLYPRREEEEEKKKKLPMANIFHSGQLVCEEKAAIILLYEEAVS